MTGTIGDWGFRIQGRAPADPRNEYQPGDWQIVAPDYFTAMRIPLVAGRFLTEDDDARAPGAILFNETLAKRAFGSAREAVGQRVMMGGDTTWRTIVGVVGDVRHRGLSADARPELYLPHAQWPTNEQGPIGRAMTLVLRTTRDPLSVVPAVRAQVRALDANVPVSHVRTMDDVLGTWAAERRLTMLVLSVLAGTAMALAAIGIYGVMAYVVAQRTHEIGVRVALGARPRDVVGMVVRQGASLALIGVGAGVVAALALTGLMSKLLFGIAPRDPITFAAIALLLSATAVVATWIPARRAAGVAPTEALRSE
jgi:predicted permease